MENISSKKNEVKRFISTVLAISIVIFGVIMLFGGHAHPPGRLNKSHLDRMSAMGMSALSAEIGRRFFEKNNRVPNNNGELRDAILNSGASRETLEDLSIGSNGEVLDAWGTPFKIKQKSGILTVVSAGPNKIFDSKDDIDSSTELSEVEGQKE